MIETKFEIWEVFGRMENMLCDILKREGVIKSFDDLEDIMSYEVWFRENGYGYVWEMYDIVRNKLWIEE